MIIALALSDLGLMTTKLLTCPTVPEQEQVHYAFQTLTRTLSYPNQVDEGDIFVAYLLAMWSRRYSHYFENFEVHVKGVLAIMRHLSQKSRANSTSAAAPLWRLIRDELLWKTEDDNWHLANRLSQEFRGVLGPKTVQQRQSYEDQLRESATPEFRSRDGWVVFGYIMGPLFKLQQVINQHKENSERDPYTESVLVDNYVAQCSIEQRKEELLLELELMPLQGGQHVKTPRDEFTILTRFHNLILLYLSRLATTALEAASIQQGLCSPEGRTASISLTSTFRRARTFMQSRVQVFHSGTVSTQKHDKLTYPG
jgi:hypothetical protein